MTNESKVENNKPRRGETGHKQVRVAWGGRTALVDEGVAPLILALWRADIDTVLSCEENRPGIVWVEFATADDAGAFLNIVADYEEGVDTLYNRINPRWRPTEGVELSAPPWEYDTWPQDAGLDGDEDDEDDEGWYEEWHSGRNDFFFPVSIRFPRSDLPVVLDRLTRRGPAREGEPTW